MSVTTRIHESVIVDNSYPDISRFGKSRIGRKLARKAIDAYHKAQRLASGRLAQSGPPIPNSEKHGHREYFTLTQAVKGGVHSGFVRDRRAQPKHNRVRGLRAWGFTIRAIAEIVGYSMRHVRRILDTPRRTLAQRWADAKARLARLTGGGHEHSNQGGGGECGGTLSVGSVAVWTWNESNPGVPVEVATGCANDSTGWRCNHGN